MKNLRSKITQSNALQHFDRFSRKAWCYIPEQKTVRKYFFSVTSRDLKASLSVALLILGGLSTDFSFANDLADKNEIHRSEYQGPDKRNIGTQKVLLKPFQQKKMFEDGGVIDFVLSPSGNLLALSKKSIWHFNVATKELKKIKIPTEDSAAKIVALNDSTYFILTKKAIFKLHTSPAVVFRKFEAEKKKERFLDIMTIEHESALKIGAISNQHFYVHEQIARSSKLIRKKAVPASTEKLKDLIFLKDQIFGRTEKRVFSYGKDDRKYKTIFKTGTKVLILSLKSGKILIQTPYSVIVIDERGEIEQTLAVSSTRKLLLTEFTPTQDLFLFDDLQIEMVTPGQRTLNYGTLDLHYKEYAPQKIALRKGTIALLDKKMVHLWKLEGQW